MQRGSSRIGQSVLSIGSYRDDADAHYGSFKDVGGRLEIPDPKFRMGIGEEVLEQRAGATC